MARQWRIEYPGALYHVLSRGNQGQDIFFTDRDRCVFLDLLKEAAERFAIQIFAFVLMDNHYHLLLKTPNANLSRSMQWFGTAYTRRFHLQNRTSGHLFGGRFRSIIVENDAYLLRLSCYIHRNPLRAKIVGRLADYPWSSYPYYAYNKKAPSWLNIEVVLGQVSGRNRRSAYRQTVQRYSEERGRIWEDVRHGLVFGSQDFVDELKERFLEDHKVTELPQHNQMLLELEPRKLAEKAATLLGLDIAGLREKRRITKEDKDRRDMLIYFLWETGKVSNQNIASILGLTYSNISRRAKLCKAHLDSDKRMRSDYQKFKSQIKV
jgi:REP element-mobilizing transposase RayT